MRYLVCLLALAAGCVHVEPSPAIEVVHPDWPPDVQSLVRQGKYTKGMTKDQFECAMAYWQGWNQRGGHIHFHPRSSSVSSDGLEIYIYQAPQNIQFSVAFFHGILQNCTRWEL